MEKKERKEDKGSMDFSTPEGCIIALENCLNGKEKLLEKKTAQMEYLVTNWTTIVSLCAQSIRSEMRNVLEDCDKEKIQSFVEESKKDPMDLEKSEDFINETIELLEDIANSDIVSDGVVG